MDYPVHYHQPQSTYDPPSQIRVYDQSPESYFYANNPYQHHPHEEEPAPPGVPLPSYAGAAVPIRSSYYHYQNAAVYNAGSHQEGVTAAGYAGVQQAISQFSYSNAGISDGMRAQGSNQRHSRSRRNVGAVPFRGRGHGRGRGRSRVHGLHPFHDHTVTIQNPISTQGTECIQGGHTPVVNSATVPVQIQGITVPILPPSKVAWCELCKVECNTLEVLEQHKNGKKHKKNLKVYEELQRLNNSTIGVQNQQASTSGSKSLVHSELGGSEGSGQDRPPQTHTPLEDPNQENEVASDKQEVEQVEPTVGPTQMQSLKPGGKRKMKKGGGLGKRVKSSDGSRRLVGPPKPKEVVPLTCELCNVKCESQVVFQSHLMGKKHQANSKRFLGQQEILGQAALKALYPALQALYPALQALCQRNLSALTASVDPQLNTQAFPTPPGNLALLGDLAFNQARSSAAGAVALPAQPSTSTTDSQDARTNHPQGSASQSDGKGAA